MKNQLPRKVVDGNYVINLASAPSGGTHWLSLRIKGKEAFYADSFGAPMPVEIIAFAKQRKGITIGYSNVILQNISSENCGYFATAILVYLERNKTKPMFDVARQYMRQFKTDSKQNDDVLRRVYQSFSHTTPALIKRLDNEKIHYEN